MWPRREGGGSWRLAGFQGEEDEAQEAGSRGLVLKEVGEQLAGGSWRRERFVDGGYPEAGRVKALVIAGSGRCQ